MILQIPHTIWQSLRVIVRNKNKPVLGSALRMNMSRRNKDGSFLTHMVKNGLLSKIGDGNPFEAKYTLTEAGLFAAEYGEFEVTLEQLVNLKWSD